jgi:hypothetical protein
MIDLKELVRPPVLLAMAGSAALGFAAGFVLGRDPQLLRRALAAAAASWEQTRLAVAEAKEEVADHWAEATEAARHDIEEKAFAATAPAAAASAPMATEARIAGEADAAKAPGEARSAAARRPRRGGATTVTRRATRGTTH